MQRISGSSYLGRGCAGEAQGTMILWTIKLLSNVKKAIAGRNHPSQLAWAVAFGLVLGLVPHGNLVALAWVLVVLSINVNHSMVAVTAIASSFLAGRLDPYSHRVGDYLLSQPRLHDGLMTAWQWPLVPWTNLNNTVVLGSLVIAMLAMMPVVIITLPIFRHLGRKFQAAEATPLTAKQSRRRRSRVAHEQPNHAEENAAHEILVVDQSHASVARPHRTPATKVAGNKVARKLVAKKTVAPPSLSSDGATSSHPTTAPVTGVAPEPHVAIETRVDVIRIADYREADKNGPSDGDHRVDEDGQPMDEAFRYLLHQLRDTQQRKAA